MTDEQFTLGNFEGLGEGSGNASDASEALSGSVPPSSAGRHFSSGTLTPEGEKGNDIVKHPTVKSDPQAKFRSPSPALQFLELELDRIVPNEFQPRRVFDPQKLEELAASIRENGIIQPLVVLPARSDGFYEILVGERRFRASKIAGLAKIPAFVSQPISDEAKLELALIENVQRSDLNPIEEARAYQRLKDEFGLRVGEIAHKVGKDESTISNLTRLLRLPVEVQRALIAGEIAEGQARPLLSLRDKEEMLAMYKIVLEQGMNVRAIEAKVREIRQRKIKVRQMFAPDPFLDSVTNLLRNRLGTKVEVNKGAKGGKITIEFYSDEELGELVRKMAEGGSVDNY